MHELAAKLSVLLPENTTIPAGVMTVPGAVSVTVAVHVIGSPTASEL